MEMTAEPWWSVSWTLHVCCVVRGGITSSCMNTRGDSETVAAALTSYWRLSLSTIKKRQLEIFAAATNQL